MLVTAYKWLVCYLLEESASKMREEMAKVNNSFTARNNSQAYYCRTLSLAYIEVSFLSVCCPLCEALCSLIFGSSVWFCVAFTARHAPEIYQLHRE